MYRPIQILAALLLLSTGCSDTPASAVGGTAGKLLLGSETTREIMVHIGLHTGNTTAELGFGVTDDAGEFRLLLPGAHGPLHLPPGEYVVWLESIGPPIRLPKDCMSPERSTLKLTCSDPARLPDLQVETADRKP